MTLVEFRATRRLVTMAQALDQLPFLADLEFGPEWTHVVMYMSGHWILSGPKGYDLTIEGDEYESRDLPLLEFVLWQWAIESPEIETMRQMIWGDCS